MYKQTGRGRHGNGPAMGEGRGRGRCRRAESDTACTMGMGARANDGICTGLGRNFDGQGQGRRNRGRVFNHGDLRLITLMLIDEKSRHGYDIIRSIEESVGGQYVPSPGVIYPTLTMLEEMGHIAAVPSDDGKKLYTSTEAGKEFLKSESDEVQALRTKLQRLKAEGSAAPAPEIIRAMHNLRLAIQLRVAHKALNTQQARTISEALDSLAVTIERMD